LLISGYPPINEFSSVTTAPSIVLLTSTVGGTIPAGATVFVGLSALGSDGLQTEMGLASINIPSGGPDTNIVTVAMTFANPLTDAGVLCVGGSEQSGLTVYIALDVG